MAARIRIILDTNWYISATINKKSRRILYKLLSNPSLIILFTDEILREYEDVISRDKFRKIINPKQVARFMNLVMSQLENILLLSNLTGSRDLKDNFLLSLSLDGNADYLITGDLDLLVLKQTGLTKIVSLNDFLKIISHTAQ
ncbi:MAG: putative toxin-antitoxin system toxin component, PIN family [Bacteroidota bacterium]|nr:putative toxin-antitoxin system toxin component, PIN family [Bacteroidota bacterium]